MSAVEPENNDQRGEWDAYSDYQLVSKWVTKSIRQAVDAYAVLDQYNQTGTKANNPNQVVRFRADILAAATRLKIELESERDRGIDYATEILDKWEGEEGYISKFRQTRIVGSAEPTPDWLDDFASDIRRAGWRLGYLRAGREEEVEDEGDSADSEVRKVIEEMTL